MKSALLTLSLVLFGSSLLGAQTTDAEPLPATWARPLSDTALRAGPSVHVPGLLDVTPSQPLRVVGRRGVFCEVLVPQGYPVHLATSYLRIEPEKQLAWVAARNLNARFVPSTVGNLPVGKVSEEHGALVLLDLDATWARVLAPEDLALYVPAAELAFADGSDGAPDAETLRSAYQRLTRTREARRQDGVTAWRALHPEWEQEDAWLAELMSWKARDVDGLAVDERVGLDARLDELEPLVTWAESRRLVAELRRETTAAQEAEAAVARERVQAEQAVERVRLAERRAAEALAREATLLDLGLRFDGRGTEHVYAGSVEVYEGLEDAKVYVLRVTETGEALKLTAAGRVVDLEPLVGQRVTLTGRRLFLPSIGGPVFVVEGEG